MSFLSFKRFSLIALAVGSVLSVGSIKADPVSEAACKSVGLSACPVPIDAKLPNPRDMLQWSQAERVIGFRNTFRLYAGDTFRPNPHNVQVLAQNDQTPLLESNVKYRVDGKDYQFNDFLKNQSVTGLLILKDGKIAYEYYDQQNTDKSLWTSRSVAKSVVGVLIGVAVKEGKIGSVDDPIVKYIPELKNTAWERANLKHILQHTSGTIWNEDYADPKSDFSQMTYCEATNDPYNCLMSLIKKVKENPKAKPGEVWSYNTAGAWLVGLVLERATGKTIAGYLQDTIWSQYGMESEGVWHALVQGKVNMGGHGFNATLRDWGRFGLFALNNGKLANGTSLLPDDWMKQSTTWTTAKGSITSFAPNGQYGYQWWFNGVNPKNDTEPKKTIHSDDTYWAFGIFGQTIAVNPTENLVVVQWSTWKNAETPQSLYDEQMVFVNAVANTLRK